MCAERTDRLPSPRLPLMCRLSARTAQAYQPRAFTPPLAFLTRICATTNGSAEGAEDGPDATLAMAERAEMGQLSRSGRNHARIDVVKFLAVQDVGRADVRVLERRERHVVSGDRASTRWGRGPR